jgi:hypothetical protein
MLVVTMKNDEGNSYPTCKPAGLLSSTDRPYFQVSTCIENNGRSVHHAKICTNQCANHPTFEPHKCFSTSNGNLNGFVQKKALDTLVEVKPAFGHR